MIRVVYVILLTSRPENSGKTCSGGDQKYKSCSTEQVSGFENKSFKIIDQNSISYTHF